MSMFKLFTRSEPKAEPSWYVLETADGLQLQPLATQAGRPLTAPLLGGWLAQLDEEGLAVPSSSGYLLTWDSVYGLMAHSEHAEALAMLELPQQGNASPSLVSRGSLEDAGFSISLGQWRLDHGPAAEAELIGAVLRHSDGTTLLPVAAYSVAQEVRTFARRQQNGACQKFCV